MARHPFIDNLSRYMAKSGLTIDDMLEAARDFDPEGYSRESLRAMYNGIRPMRIRMMSAMARGIGYPADEDPHFRVALVRYWVDEEVHGPEGALENLESLDVRGKIEVDPEVLKRIPVSRRKNATKQGTDKIP